LLELTPLKSINQVQVPGTRLVLIVKKEIRQLINR